MPSPDGRYWLVYNGEIYNHRALRGELAAEGVSFRTSSDTEVLMQWLVRRGPEGLAEARGMFALALWDARERALLVARDRFGMKPLYVHWSDRRVAFASEVGTLVRSGITPRSIDPAGVLAYFNWGSIPAPLTWVRGVEALLPGTWRRWSATGASAGGTFADVRRIWSEQAGASASAEALRERTSRALTDSVRAHLVADVPVGIFLSAGVDSGALVSVARPLQPNLHTYTISVDDDVLDEAPQAARVAARFGTTHHTLSVDARDIARDWPAILAHLDQPSGDAVNSYFVSRAVRQSGVKAVLSGVGGDEAFGGYPSFRRIRRARRLRALPAPLVAAMGRGAAIASPARGSRLQQIAGSRGDVGGIYRGLRAFLQPDEIDGMAGAFAADADVRARVAVAEDMHATPLAPETDSAAAARLETCVYLRSQLLRDLDVMSMAHGLEVRMPFVDHALLGAIWPALGHFPNLLRGKRLLVDALPSPLPAEVISAPKRGFTLPFARWMEGPLSEMVRSGLRDLAADGWIVAGAPDSVWSAWRDGRTHWSRPWTLAVLGRFLRDG
jgi:asparagine synthase (glutamine-hydrolysing)